MRDDQYYRMTPYTPPQPGMFQTWWQALKTAWVLLSSAVTIGWIVWLLAQM